MKEITTSVQNIRVGDQWWDGDVHHWTVVNEPYANAHNEWLVPVQFARDRGLDFRTFGLDQTITIRRETDEEIVASLGLGRFVR